MSERPSAQDLLATARAALLEELLPKLPADAQYTARMVARAMEIAARDIGAPPLDEALRAELAALAGREGDAGSLARVLSERIRNGDFDRDPDARERLHRALTAWVEARR
jgi:hypothetical protein